MVTSKNKRNQTAFLFSRSAQTRPNRTKRQRGTLHIYRVHFFINLFVYLFQLDSVFFGDTDGLRFRLWALFSKSGIVRNFLLSSMYQMRTQPQYKRAEKLSADEKVIPYVMSKCSNSVEFRKRSRFLQVYILLIVDGEEKQSVKDYLGHSYVRNMLAHSVQITKSSIYVHKRNE